MLLQVAFAAAVALVDVAIAAVAAVAAAAAAASVCGGSLDSPPHRHQQRVCVCVYARRDGVGQLSTGDGLMRQ